MNDISVFLATHFQVDSNRFHRILLITDFKLLTFSGFATITQVYCVQEDIQTCLGGDFE